MKLQLLSVHDPAFRPYGQVLEGYDLASFLTALAKTPCPAEGTVYQPGDKTLEADPLYEALRDRFYGGMPIQIGYCNGVNSTLNCLEYHRDSEINVAVEDFILLLALQSEIENRMVDTARVKAFLVPAGTAVELFATALHYAPCSAKPGAPFHVAAVLPLGTNTAKPAFVPQNSEDEMMTAKNKWLLAHPDSPEAKAGAKAGLTGPNLKLEEVLW